MTKHPFWNISIYKILVISVLVANFLEANSLRQTIFAKMGWNTAAYWYAPGLFLFTLFFLVWGLAYLIEVSFGLTRGAFTLRSRAGVARWFDILMFVIILAVSYAGWVTASQNVYVSNTELYLFSSDETHLFSPFLIWIILCSLAGALQSLSPWGEYRFDRSQPDRAVIPEQNILAVPEAENVVAQTTSPIADVTTESSIPVMTTVAPLVPHEPVLPLSDGSSAAIAESAPNVDPTAFEVAAEPTEYTPTESSPHTPDGVETSASDSEELTVAPRMVIGTTATAEHEADGATDAGTEVDTSASDEPVLNPPRKKTSDSFVIE